jgi:hypothetical protein
MNPAIDTNLILYFLLAVAAIACAGMLVLLYLVSRWRKLVDHSLAQLGSDINSFGMQIETLRGVQQEYSAVRRQPYTDLAAELQKKIVRAFKEAQVLEERWGRLNSAHNQIAPSRVQALLDVVPGAYRNQKTAGLMWQLRERIRAQISEAQLVAHRLEALPGEIHGQTRQTGEGIVQLEASLKELHEAGLHGKHVEGADDALLRLQQGWARIPAEFIAGQPPDAQLGEVRETTSAVYTVLNDLQPVLDEWLPRVKEWDQQYKRTMDAYDRMRNTATKFRTAIGTPPAALVVDDFRTELEKVRATARALNQRLQDPLVDDLRPLERETLHLDKVVQDAAGRYDQSVRQTEELDRALLELDTLLKMCNAWLSEPEKLQVYPLNWDVSRPLLAGLEEKTAALGGRDLPRTSAKITEALGRAAVLVKEVKAFTGKVDQSLTWHHELLALLGTGVIADGTAFSVEAKTLARAVQAYDPANWSSQDNLAGLPKEVAQLDDLQKRLTSAGQSGGVKESQLSARLEEAKRLTDLHASLRARVERVRSRLKEVQQAESEARDELERAGTTVESMALLLKDNPALQEIAAAEINRSRAEIARLEQDLASPAAGAVDRKVSKANSLLDGLSRSANGWVDKLSANLQTHTRKLADTLAALDPIANLDDRAVTDARNLLSRIGASPTNRKSGLTYLDAAAELKRWNNDWQSCSAAARALDQLAGPVLEAAGDAAQARKSAKAAFQAAGKLASGRRDWPPTRQSLAEEVKTFQQLENRLDGLRTRSIASGALVRELSQVYHELDRLEDQVTQAVHAAETEQGEAAETELQLGALQQRWQALAQRYPGQADLDLEIKDLVSQTDQRLGQLKSQYKRGAMEYDQVLSGLREQTSLLRNARFSNAEGQPVTINQEG